MKPRCLQYGHDNGVIPDSFITTVSKGYFTHDDTWPQHPFHKIVIEVAFWVEETLIELILMRQKPFSPSLGLFMDQRYR